MPYLLSSWTQLLLHLEKKGQFRPSHYGSGELTWNSTALHFFPFHEKKVIYYYTIGRFDSVCPNHHRQCYNEGPYFPFLQHLVRRRSAFIIVCNILACARARASYWCSRWRAIGPVSTTNEQTLISQLILRHKLSVTFSKSQRLDGTR